MALTGLWSRVTAGIVGLSVGGAASRAVRPIFELVEQESWDGNPNRVLAVGQLAELVAAAIVGFDAAQPEAQRSGYTGNRLRALVELSLRTPTIGAAMEARRRDEITPAQYEHVLRKAGLEPQYDAAMRALLEVLPSVTDMVRFGVREVYDPAQRAALDLDAEFPAAFATDAARLGLSRDSAGNYWAAHWELPSYTQGTEMLFRGEITPTQFDGLLKALDYAPTWRGPLEAIARRIPTIVDMIRFAVREVYDPAARQALDLDADYPAAFTPQAALHGLSEQHARQYWAAHWRLPSARQGYQMLWRGLISAAQLDQLLKALDYPPVWRARLADIARIVPGRIDLKRMLRHEIKDRGELLAGYIRLGYSPADAELMTQIAEAEVAGGTGATSYLGRARTSLFSRAHTEFVSRQLTEPEALAGLAAAGVPAAERAPILTMWSAESDLVRTELTPAQIKKAYKKALYSEPEALAELIERGMTTEDADTFLQS